MKDFTERAMRSAIQSGASGLAPYHLLSALLETDAGRRAMEERGYSPACLEITLINTRVATAALAEERGGALPPDTQADDLLQRAGERVLNGGDLEGAVASELCSGLMRCRITRSILHKARLPGPVNSDEPSPELAAFQNKVKRARAQAKQPRPIDGKPTEDGVQPTQERGPEADVRASLVDLGARAKKGDFASIVIDEEQVSALIEAISKARAPNALLEGPAGCGKTTFVEALAVKLQKLPKNHPLRGRPLLSVDAGKLVAGTRYRGDFEARVTALLKIVSSSKAILFIDEFHTIAGAGSTTGEGGLDAVNMLKPALARGDFSLIGATTPGEALRLRRDAALMRRFEQISVAPPTGAALLRVLQEGSAGLLRHHGVEIVKAGVPAVVELLSEYAPHLPMPAAGFELLDRAAARTRLAGRKKIVRKDLAEVLEAMTGAIVERADGQLSAAPQDARLCNHLDAPSRRALEAAVRQVSLGLGASGARATFSFEGDARSAADFAVSLGDSLDLPVHDVDLAAHQGPLALRRYLGSDTPEADGAVVQVLSSLRRAVLHLRGIENADPEVVGQIFEGIARGWIESTGGRRFSLRGIVLVVSGRREASSGIGFRTEEAAKPPLDPRLAGLCDAELSAAAGRENARLREEAADMARAMRKRGASLEIDDAALDGLIAGIDDSDWPAALSELRRRMVGLMAE
ncbi:AAA family ATPase [Tranquillimonas alkanivorans]|nr:AAA family ATPase [Tranquillimonas alkanivorans]